jgi:hypothetical protein
LEVIALRKLIPGVALVAVLAICAVAYAQSQVNTYTVTGSTSPTKAGTSAKHVGVSLKFNYTVGEKSGLRPSPIKTYAISFAGIKSNGGKFPKCTAQQITAAGGDSGCPSGAVMGTGSITNAAGATNNPSDKSLPCFLTLKVYNAGQGKAALFLKGGPNEPKPCVIDISTAINATYKTTSKGSTLSFNVPPNLMHPVPGVDNAVTNVQTTVKKLSKTSKGKKTYYFESIGGCKSGKRSISVKFTSEAGQNSTASTGAKCTS